MAEIILIWLRQIFLSFRAVGKKIKISIKTTMRGFPGGAVVENLPANAEDMGSSPGLGSSHVPRSN